MINNNTKIGVIGAGMVGLPLAELLAEKNILDFILIRNPQKAAAVPQIVRNNAKIYNDISQIPDLPDIIVLTVRNSAYKEIADKLAEQFKSNLANKYIFHTSGPMSLEVLEPLKNYGAYIFSAHPFQTFFEADKNVFNNLIWGIDKGNTPIEDISQIIAMLNGKPLFLNDFQIAHKDQYHLIAVACSNFLFGIIEFAKLLGGEINLNNKELVSQILYHTIEVGLNNFDDINKFPISGPLSRGDKEVLLGHINSLKSAEHLQNAYKYFSLATLELLEQSNVITQDKAREIKELMKT
ncbi:MAG: DUF2520 domain-containing protein [Candidatus Kapabacteria bacterium]|nr:DUF2520 domain-containing protein [Candidatus Kapabacteria bacterium]